VHHLDGRFAAGSMTAVVGPNGAGKSTLLSALAGQMPPSAGGIEIDAAPRAQVAYLPQQSTIDRSFPIAVEDVVLLGHWARIGALRGASRDLRDAAGVALHAVGLHGFERRTIGELSVGQFQRVLFARVLLQDARVILLDEPFSAIDARTTADLLGVLARWHAEKRTIVAVLHDTDQVRNHFPDTLLLAREPIAWGPTAHALAPRNLLRARQMAEAWDEAAPRCARAAA